MTPIADLVLAAWLALLTLTAAWLCLVSFCFGAIFYKLENPPITRYLIEGPMVLPSMHIVGAGSNATVIEIDAAVADFKRTCLLPPGIYRIAPSSVFNGDRLK